MVMRSLLVCHLPTLGFEVPLLIVSIGFIAGEGLGGVVGAVLTLAGVDGTTKGTALGCPMLEC